MVLSLIPHQDNRNINLKKSMVLSFIPNQDNTKFNLKKIDDSKFVCQPGEFGQVSFTAR